MTGTTYPTEPCGTCGRPIIRAVHERTLGPSVIDAEPTPDGNIALGPGAPPTYRVLKVADRFGRTDLRVTHFATCPQAGTWRRRRRTA
jgi:hypothetical protein